MNNQQRLLSLDAFRGLTIAGMVLVNDPGSSEYIYPQLRHAAWHGWTVTDWVFPFFLFIVGVAMTFSFAKRLEQEHGRRDLYRHVVYRAVMIFALGLFLNGFPFWFDPNFSLATWRIPGVLQRIAVCYLAASLIIMNTRLRTQAFWAAGCLVSYSLLVWCVPVPGYGAGVLEPTGNLPWFVDSALLKGHTWIYAPAEGFDPEGILSTIPALATTLVGVLTGHWLRSSRSREEKTAWMFVAGHALLLGGVLLDPWFPINKNMWSASFVLFTGGWALICFAILYWLVDVKGWTRWATPMEIFGRNAIAIYAASELAAILLWTIRWAPGTGGTTTLHDWLYDTLFAPLASPMNASLAFAVVFVLAMYAVAWGLWKKRWFLKF